MPAERHGAFLAWPVTPPQQDYVEVQHRQRKRNKVDHRGQRDHSGGEIAELLSKRQSLNQPLKSSAQDDSGVNDKNRHRAEYRSQNERNCEISRKQGGQHAHAHQCRAHQPISEVGGEHQAYVGTAQPPEDDQMAQREHQRRRVNRHGSQILAHDNLHVGCRKRQQQLVGPVELLFGPQGHRDGRDQKQKQVREDAIQRVEVGQIIIEKSLLPKGGYRAQKDEQRNENVAGGTAEVAVQLALEDGFRNSPTAVHGWTSVALPAEDPPEDFSVCAGPDGAGRFPPGGAPGTLPVSR